MKALKKLLPIVVVVIVLAVGAMSALATSAGFDAILPAGGGHVTLASGTKSYTSSYATVYAQTQNNYAFMAWIDGTQGQATDSRTCYTGNNTLNYTRYVPALNSGVSLRASTTGLFTDFMRVNGNVNFN